MFLFIFESIGTSELLLIGVVALIFLGPRKMPEYARKLGKLMNEFRSTTNEFKATWEREVNFEEETRAFHAEDDPVPVPRIGAVAEGDRSPAPPSITEADPGALALSKPAESNATPPTTDSTTDIDINDRKNWL